MEAMVPVYDRYFEKQTAANCGVHAVNNAVGLKLCTVEDMHAAAALMQHALHRQTAFTLPFDTASGDFEIDCMQAALLQKGWTYDLLRPPHETGHVEEGWAALRHMPGHWTAVLFWKGRWWPLVSKKQPVLITTTPQPSLITN